MKRRRSDDTLYHKVHPRCCVFINTAESSRDIQQSIFRTQQRVTLSSVLESSLYMLPSTAVKLW